MSSTVCTVGQIEQTNRYAYLMHDYLPEGWVRPNEPDTIIPLEELQREGRNRIFLYVARQVAGLPTLFMAPGSYLLSSLGGLLAGGIGGFCKEIRWPAPGSLKKQWKDWMNCTVILESKYAKLEKATEGTIAVANGIFAFVWVPETGVYSGFMLGATYGWTAGRWVAQRIHSDQEGIREPLLGGGSSTYIPSGGANGGEYRPPNVVFDV